MESYEKIMIDDIVRQIVRDKLQKMDEEENAKKNKKYISSHDLADRLNTDQRQVLRWTQDERIPYSKDETTGKIKYNYNDVVLALKKIGEL